MTAPSDGPRHHEASGPTRRQLLAGTGGLAALAGVGVVAATRLDDDEPAVTGEEAPSAPVAGGVATVAVALEVNGQARQLDVDTRTSLLDALREQLQLTGTKKGCDQGQCGACTVHLDDRRVVSCLTMAAQADGARVTTIEGLEGSDGTLHPLQQAFIDNDGAQCGYCTPGQIMSGVMCVREGHADSVTDIREYMSGNLCRCGCYVGIVQSIQQAAPEIRRS